MEKTYIHKITTIIPIYKGIRYIEKQIQQIEEAAKKLDEQLELIFVNDDPSVPLDDTLHSGIIDIVVLQTDQNRGIQGARVYGLANASGEYVHFLDQDDEISTDFYFSQLEGIGDADLIYCRCYNGNRESYTLNQVFETVMDRELRLCKIFLPVLSHVVFCGTITSVFRIVQFSTLQNKLSISFKRKAQE